jgi:GT2 family glycosyltransferase
MTTPKLVTIGLPMWKRLEYLPHILKIIEAQDYPSIELLVSDNGMNGNKVRDTVQAHYSRPFKFRQNSSIAEIPKHFNQIVQHATGEYFVLLSDDDEITPNFVSELVHLLERYPEANVAFARQDVAKIRIWV